MKKTISLDRCPMCRKLVIAPEVAFSECFSCRAEVFKLSEDFTYKAPQNTRYVKRPDGSFILEFLKKT